MKKITLAVIEGTTRKDRKSIRAARYITRLASEHEVVEAVLVDPREYTFPFDGEDKAVKDPAYTKVTQDADAFFIVVPEYNHSFPGSLKRMLDSELKNYIHKPVALAGVSSGNWGGVRAIEALVPVVRELGMVCTFTDVQFPKITSIFDEAGHLLDASYEKRVRRALTELVWMAQALKYGRENLPSKYHKKTNFLL